MSTETMQRVKVGEIVASPTNPRKDFQTADWPDFVRNVQTHGVIQAVTVRPHPTMRGKYELVAGERRWRAAGEAKLADVPAIVRTLSDAEAVEIQQIENLQRADLSALDEAQGYADWVGRLMGKGTRQDAASTGRQDACPTMTKEEAVAFICSRVNRERATVYGRLALLKASAAVRTALGGGKLDASKAQLIAQVPGEMQTKLLKQALEGQYGDEEPLSYRALKGLIAEQYRRPLKGAAFDVKREYPAAEGLFAKACAECPWHGSKAEGLEGDKNVCLNPACFGLKIRAESARLIAEARAKGKPVIPAEEYAKARYGSYQEADEKCYEDHKGRTYKQLALKAGIQPIVTVNSEGEAIEVLAADQVKELKKELEIPHYGGSGGYGEQDRKNQKKKKQIREQCGQAMGEVAAALLEMIDATGKNYVSGTRLWRMLAEGVCRHMSLDEEAAVAKAWGLAEKNTEVRDAWKKWFADTKTKTIKQYQEYMIAMLLLAQQVEGWDKTKMDKEFVAAAELAGVDLAEFAEKPLEQKGTKGTKGGKKK